MSEKRPDSVDRARRWIETPPTAPLLQSTFIGHPRGGSPR